MAERVSVFYSFTHFLDLAGTFVFALSGAIAAVDRRLDIFGVLGLSFVAGNCGGITRDVLIGAVPPAVLVDERYLLASVLAGLIVFLWSARVDKLRTPMLVFDAAGLSLFAVTGAQRAIDHDLSPVMASLLGMVTGIGGGMARDILLAEIPQVLRFDLYAVAALIGASVVVLGHNLHISDGASALTGAALCFAVRFMAITRGWRLPTAHDRAKAHRATEQK